MKSEILDMFPGQLSSSLRSSLSSLSRLVVSTARRSVNSSASQPYQSLVTSVLEDDVFQQLYETNAQRFSMKPSQWRKDRFYNLYELFKSTEHIDGAIAECGCWRGLSASILCGTQKATRPNYQGEGFHIFDSFAGLSEFNKEEKKFLESKQVAKGSFAATLDQVKLNLSEFPKIQYHPGYIPDTFVLPEDLQFRFVHVDVDLADPTLAAFEYFYPRMQPGGIILSDDYGSHLWKETKKRLDAFSRDLGIPLFRLSTGQCFVMKGHSR